MLQTISMQKDPPLPSVFAFKDANFLILHMVRTSPIWATPA